MEYASLEVRFVALDLYLFSSYAMPNDLVIHITTQNAPGRFLSRKKNKTNNKKSNKQTTRIKIKESFDVNNSCVNLKVQIISITENF